MSYGVGYMRTETDWMLMKIFATKEVAEATGIPVARIYEYNRNLISILAEVKAKMK